MKELNHLGIRRVLLCPILARIMKNSKFFSIMQEMELSRLRTL